MKFYHTLYDENDPFEVEVEFRYITYKGDVDDVLDIRVFRDGMAYFPLRLQFREIESLCWIKADQDYREGREEAYNRRLEERKYL